MDPACLGCCLTDQERDEFERNGFFIVEDVLPPRLIEELSAGCPLGGWHPASPNSADEPRQVLFFGYSYRWLRPRDDMTGARWIDRVPPGRTIRFERSYWAPVVPVGTVIPRPRRKTCRSRAGSASISVPRPSPRDAPPYRSSEKG